VPFPVPIDTPSSDPLDGASNSVSFNDEWAPIVLGVLKILTRGEIWQGDTEADIELAMQRAHTLLASIEDFSALCPEFYPEFYQGFFSWDESLANMQAIDTGDCHGNEREYSTDVTVHPLLGIARLGLRFLDIGDDSPVGGLVDELYIEITDLTVGNVFTVDWDDCTGTHNQDIAAGNTYVRINFYAKNLNIEALGNFSADIGISGQVVCVEA
jgi:hypothetical protein